jgi:hypothetical protein
MLNNIFGPVVEKFWHTAVITSVGFSASDVVFFIPLKKREYNAFSRYEIVYITTCYELCVTAI